MLSLLGGLPRFYGECMAIQASVIVPVYNGEETIVQCVESALKQNFEGEYEVIVVNDGSTDQTEARVKKSKDVKLISQPNKGPAAARNRGALEAKGEFIVFMDDDCAAEKDWLREMLKPFADQEVVGVQGRYKNAQKEFIAQLIQLEIEERYEKLKKQKYVDHIGTYSAAYRRETFLAVKGFDEKFPIASGEDIDLSYRLAERGHKLVFNWNAIVWHQHPVSVLHYYQVKFWRAYWRVRMYSKHKQKIMQDSYTSQNVKLQIGLCYVFFVGLGGLFFTSKARFIVVLTALAWVVSILKFWRFALRKRPLVGIISPVFLALRTFVFAAGFAYGVFREVLLK